LSVFFFDRAGVAHPEDKTNRTIPLRFQTVYRVTSIGLTQNLTAMSEDADAASYF
jgi:hypothetical protein